MSLTMKLDAKKVELLFRAALLDDAKNMNERIAALIAEIDVDDDEKVWITLDTDLWPEDKEMPEVEAIAKMIWFEIEWVGTDGMAPFAWSGMGKDANKTSEYFKMVLEAYRGQASAGGD